MKAIVLLTVLLTVSGLTVLLGAIKTRDIHSASGVNDTSIIAGYRNWTLVNPEPVKMLAPVAILCAPVTQVMADGEKGNPHRDKFISVYVNDVGKRAMLIELQPHFPKGSIIVKQKLTTKSATDPELLTVMIKRDAEFDPSNGDWEYMVFDGTGKTVQAQGKLENCQSCHLRVKDTDYVNRTYLPKDVRQKLQ